MISVASFAIETNHQPTDCNALLITMNSNSTNMSQCALKILLFFLNSSKLHQYAAANKYANEDDA